MSQRPIRAKTIKRLEENAGIRCHDLELGNGFLAMKSKRARNKRENQ